MRPEQEGGRFWRELLAHPLVLGILALKLLASATLAGQPLTQWFAPFVGLFASQGGDPWAAFQLMGQPKAFPYPPGMLYMFAPLRWLGDLLSGAGRGDLGPVQLLAMRLPLLAADLAIYAVLGLWFRDRLSTVRLFWWCSPVVFYISYVHGQLDLVATAIFLVSLYALERQRYALALAVFGAALTTKHHLWIAYPFLLIYLRPRVSWASLAGLALLPLAIVAAVEGPWYSSPAFQAMVLHAEEQSWVFSYALPVGKWGTALLLCPAALLFVFARYASYPRHNWDLTALFLGLAFSIFILLVPPMPGWYAWSLPFFVYYACRFSRSAGLLLTAFSLSYLAYFLLGQRSDLAAALAPVLGWRLPEGLPLDPSRFPLFDSAAFTLLQASVASLAMVMYARGVRSNDVYSARAKPLMIGIAGDSGAGKDRLAGLLEDLFPRREVMRLNGDDYHRWERGDQNWELLTHLDPKANRLHEQLEHVISLRSGRGVAKGVYDHASGRFTARENVDPRQNILVQGLHSFLLPRQRELFDLKVFLDPEEKLRIFWKLKRDAAERGQGKAHILASLRRRAPDRHRSILPQKAHADLVVRYASEPGADLRRLDSQPPLRLEVEAHADLDLEKVAAALQSLEGLELSLAGGRMSVRGQAGAEALARAAVGLLPELFDLTGTRPEFQAGLDGVLQLTLLAALAARLR